MLSLEPGHRANSRACLSKTPDMGRCNRNHHDRVRKRGNAFKRKTNSQKRPRTFYPCVRWIHRNYPRKAERRVYIHPLASRRRPTTKEGNQSQIVRAAHAVYNISTDYPAPPSLSKKPSPHRTWTEGINGEKARIAWTDKCNQSTPSSLLKPPWPGEFVRPGIVAAVGLFILPINPEVGVPRPHRPFVTTFMARCSASARSC